MTTSKKYPLDDLGDDFDPKAMPDYQERLTSGEFANKTIEQIRSIYIQEEVDQVNEDDDIENYPHLEEI